VSVRAGRTASNTTSGSVPFGHTTAALGHTSTGQRSHSWGQEGGEEDEDDITLGLEIESQLADSTHEDLHLLKAQHRTLLRRLPHIKLSR
jgi:hypothetical protein